MKKKTHEEYVAELATKNPTVEVVGTYVDAKTKIAHHCLIHDVYWDASPQVALNGGCPECKKDKIGAFRRRAHEEYIEEVAKISPHIVVMGKYTNAKTQILHWCTIHDIKWTPTPESILDGCGCWKCGGGKIGNNKRKPHKQYVKEVARINKNIVVLGKYIDSKTPILHKCLIHNVEWCTSPSNILKGKGCRECKKDKIRDKNSRTHEQYIKELKNINPDILVLGIYKNAKTPILHKCLIDGHEWCVTPDSLLQGFGCPQCNESSGERLIRQFLQSNNIIYEYQKVFDNCRDIKPLPFDFYLPTYNICIEYDGRQHYESIECFGGEEKFELQQKHDAIKTEYCKNNNMKLLRIPYFKNTEEELNNFLFI
jgi:hypothetical protein